jgi:hypothetical protein
MGLEYTGYTPRNIEELWIDPYDYQDQLEEAVDFLTIRNMSLSIYNHQLCVLKPSLWNYARKSISDWKTLYLPECEKCSVLPTRKSISDWKTLYLPECEKCSVLPSCGGLFQWAVKKHSDYIHTIQAPLSARTQ